MDELTLSFEPAADPAVRKIIIDGVDLHNVAATGHDAFSPITYVLRTAQGEIAGGLTGFLWGRWLQVQNLWVAHAFRGRRQATRLMDAAESLARARNCIGATLETHDFQALGFYQKRGYAVFGTLADYPPGHAKHFLRKSLVSP